MTHLGDIDGRRLALVVATSTYTDRTLQQLRSPGQDAVELSEVLADPSIGGFDVVSVIDRPADKLQRAIVEFCREASPSDLVLLYLSCHGVLDDRGRLYYATVNTERELLSATAVRAEWLNEQFEDCRSRSQIVVLDCCHSGAFAKGSKGESTLALKERFEGRGRIVLTASRATEYSFEGERTVGEGTTSVFTAAVIDGLRTGDADRDKDGLVTVPDLYNYVYDSVKRTENRQTPLLWTYGAEGNLVIARSPRGAIIEPAALPEHLRLALESPGPRIREGAVQELSDILVTDDAALALRARLTLEDVANRDIPSIADTARGALLKHQSPSAMGRSGMEGQSKIETGEHLSGTPLQHTPPDIEGRRGDEVEKRTPGVPGAHAWQGMAEDQAQQEPMTNEDESGRIESKPRSLGRIRSEPRLLAAGGGALLVLIMTIAIASMGGSPSPTPPSTPATTPASSPPSTTPSSGLGAIAVAYNVPGVKTGLKLNSSALANLFLGKITAWNDPEIARLNPGIRLPGTAVTPVRRTDASETTREFSSFLAASNSSWRTHVGSGRSVAWPTGVGALGDAGVASATASTSGAVGYMSSETATALHLAVAAVTR